MKNKRKKTKSQLYKHTSFNKLRTPLLNPYIQYNYHK